jgi:hypothetical protein
MTETAQLGDDVARAPLAGRRALVTGVLGRSAPASSGGSQEIADSCDVASPRLHETGSARRSRQVGRQVRVARTVFDS